MKTSASAFGLPRASTLPTLVKTPVDASVVDNFTAADTAINAPPLAANPLRKEAEPSVDARLVVSMPSELHRNLKIRCAERGVTIRSYMVSLLKADGLRDE